MNIVNDFSDKLNCRYGFTVKGENYAWYWNISDLKKGEVNLELFLYKKGSEQCLATLSRNSVVWIKSTEGIGRARILRISFDNNLHPTVQVDWYSGKNTLLPDDNLHSILSIDEIEKAKDNRRFDVKKT